MRDLPGLVNEPISERLDLIVAELDAGTLRRPGSERCPRNLLEVLVAGLEARAFEVAGASPQRGDR